MAVLSKISNHKQLAWAILYLWTCCIQLNLPLPRQNTSQQSSEMSQNVVKDWSVKHSSKSLKNFALWQISHANWNSKISEETLVGKEFVLLILQHWCQNFCPYGAMQQGEGYNMQNVMDVANGHMGN